MLALCIARGWADTTPGLQHFCAAPRGVRRRVEARSTSISRRGHDNLPDGAGVERGRRVAHYQLLPAAALPAQSMRTGTGSCVVCSSHSAQSSSPGGHTPADKSGIPASAAGATSRRPSATTHRAFASSCCATRRSAGGGIAEGLSSNLLMSGTFAGVDLGHHPGRGRKPSRTNHSDKRSARSASRGALLPGIACSLGLCIRPPRTRRRVPRTRGGVYAWRRGAPSRSRTRSGALLALSPHSLPAPATCGQAVRRRELTDPCTADRAKGWLDRRIKVQVRCVAYAHHGTLPRRTLPRADRDQRPARARANDLARHYCPGRARRQLNSLRPPPPENLLLQVAPLGRAKAPHACAILGRPALFHADGLVWPDALLTRPI